MNPTSPRRRWLRYGPFAAVVLIPLAFAGLFVGAVSQLNHGIDSIPAVIVNNDQFVTQKAADGSSQPILAGRELVTQLTGKNSKGFSWTITNGKDAKAALASGKVYAILTVPKDFSSSIVSLGGSSPQRATLAITTDDAHNYLTGSVAQVVGDSLARAFGTTITQHYLAGIYSSIGTVGGSLSKAADGATKLSSGAGSLSTGLSSLSAGVGATQSGASTLAGGVTSYVGGVKTLATGLHKLQSGAASLNATVVGVQPYTAGVSTISSQLAAAVAALNADPTDATARATVTALSHALAQTAANGPAIVGGVNQSYAQLASGAGQSAAGADTIASAGASLSSGASSLASGLAQLSTGASTSASGAKSLSSGASALASGLNAGAKQVPSYTAAQSKNAADVASSPVGVTVHRENKVSSVGQIIATLFVPLGLWIGSLAVFLVMRPLTRRTLSSTAANGRLVLSAVGRASLVTAAQALLLVGLLHLAVGVSWSLLPATILFSLVMALAFTAFHYLLTIGLGRAGLVVSILLLAIQITSTGGLYPIQLLATPFQIVSPLLPLTYGVAGMQAIIANSGVVSAITAALALVAFGVGSLLLSLVAVRRVRRARALGLVPAVG